MSYNNTDSNGQEDTHSIIQRSMMNKIIDQRNMAQTQLAASVAECEYWRERCNALAQKCASLQEYLDSEREVNRQLLSKIRGAEQELRSTETVAIDPKKID